MDDMVKRQKEWERVLDVRRERERKERLREADQLAAIRAAQPVKDHALVPADVLDSMASAVNPDYRAALEIKNRRTNAKPAK